MKKLNIKTIILWIILPIIIAVFVSFCIPRTIITEIELKANDYTIDAYITNKFFLSHSKKVNEIINDVKHVKVNLLTYKKHKKYEIIFENSYGKEHTVIPKQFAYSDNPPSFLEKRINKAIQSKTNNTFIIEDVSATFLNTFFSLLVILFYIGLLYGIKLRKDIIEDLKRQEQEERKKLLNQPYQQSRHKSIFRIRYKDKDSDE